ncbi:VOC family protein [Ligilactobacillus pobuzihii]|uniref:SMU1112c/YaeR family gloxylase I-like metalloprotein n=1 Tax=Ligilactobacillus pobuzihii TaxID=449659 RepID=UPI0019CF53D3|nr:VOC family protein [Ligilactobacillus pobuzihii]MBN7274830.1 VOC family protein [Ligilactobacillus pobuzihii]
MIFAEVDHLAVICHDEKQALDFYVNKLGFTIKDRHVRLEKEDILFHLVGAGLTLELFIKPTAPTRVTDPEATGLRHLSFKVKDVEQVVAQLAQCGIECEPIRQDEFTGEKMTFFFDPDHLPLEIHE